MDNNLPLSAVELVPRSELNCNSSMESDSVITQHTHSYTSTAYTTPYAEWPSPEERE